MPIRVAGGGYGAKVALPAYRELKEFEPVAVWSRRLERARLAEDFDVELGTADFDELLSAPGLEAVHIATPVVTHLPFALAAAERGLHVLCEKPLAANLAEAREIFAAIRAAGVVAGCNRNRSLPSVEGPAATPSAVKHLLANWTCLDVRSTSQVWAVSRTRSSSTCAVQVSRSITGRWGVVVSVMPQ